MNPPRYCALLLLFALGSTCFVGPSAAAPPARDPAALPVCALFRDQNVVAAVPDGRGGEIVAWLDGRDGVHWVIFTQHVRRDLTLDPAWPVDGLAPAPVTLGQAGATMVEDGAGGAIIAWVHGGTSYADLGGVRTQHVLADGTLDPRWPVGGRTLAAASGDQIEPAIVSDGKGGAIVGWIDRRSQLVFELYAQHVRVDGTLDPAWPEGGRKVPGSPPQLSLAAVTDATGGALFFWSEHVPNGQSQFMAQHVVADGTIDPRWPVLGRPLSAVNRIQQYALSVIPDGAHGAMAAWVLATFEGQHVVVQHVPGDGAIDPAWSDTGRVASHGQENQYDPILCGDERGGVFVAWGETPHTHQSRHLAHLSASGEIDPEWPIGGVLLGPASGGGAVSNLLPDGKGGTLATCFLFHSDATHSALVQHVKASGRFDPAWPTGGQEVIAPATIERLPAIVPDGEGGEFAAWSQRGVPSQGTDAFASVVRANGRPVRADDVGKTATAALLAEGLSSQAFPGLALALTSGNPASRGTTTVLHFALPRAAHARLDVYDVAGRLVATVFDGALPAGPGEFRWNGDGATGRSVGAGLYFYRLSADGDRLTVRGIKF